MFACTFAGVCSVQSACTSPKEYVCVWILRVRVHTACVHTACAHTACAHTVCVHTACTRVCLFVCVRKCLFVFVSVLRINIM